jgi:glucose-6-phosphate 1-dehydrogenase
VVNQDIHKSIPSLLSPTILTIFGATGDLSADYLIPALLHMSEHKLLPKSFKLICVGRRDLNTKTYLDFIIKKSEKIKKLSLKNKQAFLKHLTYFKADFANLDDFKSLAKVMSDFESPKHECYNRLFYFATSPHQFAEIAHLLKSSGLLVSCGSHDRKVRVLVEKPFGFNLKSAQALNSLLLKYFTEEQIYRIDHYVGKETVQNLMVVRFANSLFEPLWNNRFIDHVEISVLEEDGVGERLNFYEQTGAIKDFLQNHILQMLALIAMDEPYNLTAEFIRNEKLKVLKALEKVTPEKLSSRLVKGQYQGYVKESAGLNKETGPSQTETFFALKTYINLPRWQGVPFYLRTGKKLSKKLTEISIHFREPIRCLFEGCGSNVLTFQIQPNESVRLQINNKIPGFGIKLHQADLDFNYKMSFKGEIPGAYERLLLDFLEGDQRLYIRSDEIEAAWKFVDSIVENPEFKKLPLHIYKPKSNGPKEATDFIEKDLKEWWTR